MPCGPASPRPGSIDLRETYFRSNAAYELVPLSALPAVERSGLARLLNDGCQDVLLPRRAGFETRAVSPEAAALFTALCTAAPLPASIRSLLGEQCFDIITGLVLDQILEVQADGAFISGPAARALFARGSSGEAESGVIGRLSLAALQYAASFRGETSIVLAGRLYRYNAQPASPSWRQRFCSDGAVERFLGLEPGGRSRRILDRAWRPAGSAASADHWIGWWRAGAVAAERPAYKLYISPRCEALPEAFPAAVETLTASRAVGFKAGKGVYGLLRPDKLVAYFASFAELEGAAAALRSILGGVAPQGVPFTSRIDEQGLLSWGRDPPAHARLPVPRDASWRQWITNRLAAALVQAEASGLEQEEAYRFALDRVGLDGVNVSTWTVDSSRWDEAPAEQS